MVVKIFLYLMTIKFQYPFFDRVKHLKVGKRKNQMKASLNSFVEAMRRQSNGFSKKFPKSKTFLVSRKVLFISIFWKFANEDISFIHNGGVVNTSYIENMQNRWR